MPQMHNREQSTEVLLELISKHEVCYVLHCPCLFVANQRLGENEWLRGGRRKKMERFLLQILWKFQRGVTRPTCSLGAQKDAGNSRPIDKRAVTLGLTRHATCSPLLRFLDDR